MPGLDILLELQEIDHKRSQIEFAMKNLPQRTQLAEAEEQSRQLDPDVADLRTKLEAIAKRQDVREKEIARLENKTETDQKRLYEGSITSPKEATALSHEIETLQEHLRTEEDSVLELMAKAEPLQAQLDDLMAKQDELAEQMLVYEQQITVAEAEAVVADEKEAAQRQALVATIDPDLIAVYEQHQVNTAGGKAVGLLEGGSCSACNLSLATGERERIQALSVDEPADCPECGALLIRMAS